MPRHLVECSHYINEIYGLGIRPIMSKYIPLDFIDRRKQGASVNVLAAEYKVCNKTIRRWIAHLGLPRLPNNPPAPIRRKRIKPPARINPPMRVADHEVAADILRKNRPVYRCDSSGKFTIDGKFYMVGRKIMSQSQVVQMASNEKPVIHSAYATTKYGLLQL